MIKKTGRLLFFIFIILYLVIRNFHSAQEQETTGTDYEQIACDEFEESDSILQAHLHQRSWLEYTKNDVFCTQYQFLSTAVTDSYTYRNDLDMQRDFTDEDFWKHLYSSLYEYDKDKLNHLQDSLRTIGDSRQLDHGEFARFVVAFVQDIPYNYIIPDDCTNHTDHPCLPNVRFGILSPVEFLYSLQGDCDTRTVLLYTLLRNFGYNPIIINSKEYRHSMLALDIPASGDDFIYKGRIYSYWETTNIGWLPGMLPPSMNNKDYWTVALDYEYETNPPGSY
jgi:hypothetical protein